MSSCLHRPERVEHDPRLKRVIEIVNARNEESYVVGGVLRSRLCGLPDGADLDMAIRGDGFRIAQEIAEALGKGATFVPLDRSRGTGRVVLTAQPRMSVDISSFRGNSIEEDLRSRDFTINALALDVSSFRDGEMTHVLDPTGGRQDLRDRIVRACSSTAFLEDPLRILRAFRFAACLGLSISGETKSAIANHAELLPSVAVERIRDELFDILSSPCAAAALKEMEELGVVTAVFPELKPMKECSQNWYHHLAVWEHTVEGIRNVERIVSEAEDIFGSLGETVRAYLEGEIVVARPRAALVKLAMLFHDSGKPATRTVDPGGRIRFFGHEKTSTEIAESAWRHLQLATREIRIALGWVAGHMRPGILLNPGVTRRAIYRLCHHYGEDVIGLFVLFLADLAASQGPERRPGADKQAEQSVKRALDYCFTENAQTPRLLGGRDLITIFGLQEGPEIGYILGRLAELQGSGEITTRDDALAAVPHLLRDRIQDDRVRVIPRGAFRDQE